MSTLPRTPKHGDPISVLPGIIGNLIDYVRSITPCSSHTVRVSRQASGTTFHAIQQPSQTTVSSATVSDGWSSWMFFPSVTPKLDEETGEQVGAESGSPVWLVSMRSGTAQALFGNSQPISDIIGREVSIPAGEVLYIYLTYMIYDGPHPEDAVHSFLHEAFLSLSVPTSTWHTKYFILSTISSDGRVNLGHIGAVVLPTPKNVVDKEPKDA